METNKTVIKLYKMNYIIKDYERLEKISMFKKDNTSSEEWALMWRFSLSQYLKSSHLERQERLRNFFQENLSNEKKDLIIKLYGRKALFSSKESFPSTLLVKFQILIMDSIFFFIILKKYKKILINFKKETFIKHGISEKNQ